MKSVSEIVREYLVSNGFDGLYTDGCGCGVDDLFPCGNEGCVGCDAAYLYRCKDCVKECPDRGLLQGFDTFYAGDNWCQPEYRGGEHLVVHDSFADWNMPRELAITRIVPPHTIEIVEENK